MKTFVLLLFEFLFLFLILTDIFCQQEKVSITFKVVPLFPIPENESIFIMDDFNDWDPGSMGYGNSGWELAIELQKDSLGFFSTTQVFNLGDTVKYLFTRGSHYSIEFSSENKKRNERTIIADRNKTVVDTIDNWRDYYLSETNNEFIIQFKKQNPEKIIRNGKPWTIFGSLLYDREMRNTFASGYKIYNKVNKIPADLTDTISFPFVISDAPDNSILVFAGKRKPYNKWLIFIDKNNDNEIDESEFIFEALESKDTTSEKEDTVIVEYDNLVEDKIEKDSLVFIIASYNKPIFDHYKSCLREDAPVLGFGLNSDLREGVLQFNNYNISIGALPVFTGHNYGFKNYFNLLIDINKDSLFEISKGSPENVEVYNELIEQAINLGDFSLNIIDVDNQGNWLKVFISDDIGSEIKNTTAGNPAPDWDGTTLTGENISSQSLKGRYILLDFWATWCKPCIGEIKNIKQAYMDFNKDKLQIVGILINENKEKVQSFIDKNKIDWSQIFDEESIVKNIFSVKGIPDPILISPEGVIIERGESLRGSNLKETLIRYLSK